MDETESADVVTVGQRLREARESKGLSIEEIAAQTRIPTRHLASLENSDWDRLPAATYSIGFAKNFAAAVGLDRTEIGEQLRAEMGGTRPAIATPEVYQAADPARTMPKGLVIGALALLALFVLGLTWFNNRSLQPDEPAAEASNVEASGENAIAAPAPEPTSEAPDGPVVLTAIDVVWIEVKDGSTILKQGQLAPGETYQVPANANAPVLTTGKPEALRIAVGTKQAPPIGVPGRTVTGVSLRAPELLKATATPAVGGGSEPAPTSAALPRPSRGAAPSPPPAETLEPSVTTDNPPPSTGTDGETAAQQ
ncbi:MAG TPA: RodZ domain-containing protein [Sphingomicrobium sp.]|nr:RodZ domain-containing protein [Sphingomicrobium sp.]